MQLEPIGTIHNDCIERRCHPWSTVVSEIVCRPNYIQGLTGLHEFSHIWILFWFHDAEDSYPIMTHPQKRKDLPLVGLFATRTPMRPNPIGLTAVRLLSLTSNRLIVQGLDAIDGTPVLDIKPYIHYSDCVTNVTYPEWLYTIHQEKDTK